MSCENHKKEVSGISDMKVLAEMIGDLHYETLTKLLGMLGTKIYADGVADRIAGRTNLGYALHDASNQLLIAASFINNAWLISKPFMEPKKLTND